MARINVEERFWFDPRLKALKRELGEYEATGQVLEFWRLAQQYFINNENIPHEHWNVSGLSEFLIKFGFAIKHKDNSVSAQSGAKHFRWLIKAKEDGRIGGQLSSQRNRDRFGRLLPKKESKGHPRVIQGSPSTIQSSTSTSTSTSTSKNKEINTYALSDDIACELNGVYLNYPRKRGKQQGMKIAIKQIASKEDLDKFKKAVSNFRLEMIKESRPEDKILYFSSFMKVWKDWINIETTSQPKRTFTFNKEAVV